MKKNRLIKISMLFLITSVIIFIISVFYNSYKTIYINKRDDLLRKYQEELNLFEKFKKEYNQWDNIDKELKEFYHRYMFKIKDFSNFRGYIDEIVKKNSLSIDKMGFSIKDFFKKFKRLKVNLVVIGDYNNIKRFVYTILNDKNLLVLKRMKLIKLNELVRGNFELEAYFVK